MTEFEQVLKQFDLQHCIPIFRRHRVELDIFMDLSDDDLREMDVPLGDRKRVHNLVRHLQQNAERGSALPVLNPIEGDGQSEAQMRLISALFADLVGSTAISEKLDAEDYHSTLEQFHKSCTETVLRFGGTPARFIGDAQLACFGYPQAGDDDGARATAAGIEIIKTIPKLTTPDGKPLRARIGIATGVAMTGDLLGERSDSFGPASGSILNLAARLQSLAEPGSVLIDDQTRSVLGRTFQVKALGSHELKGFSEPKDVWQAVDVDDFDANLSRQDAAHVPLIGRDDELELLHRRWTQSKRSGWTVLVTGEAGIGKSRLVDDFMNAANIAGAQVLKMECLPNENLRLLQPFIKALETRAGLTEFPNPPARRRRLDTWVTQTLKLSQSASAQLAELMYHSTTRAQPTPLPAHLEGKASLFELLVQVLERLSLDQPLLCVIEDLHWIDPTTEEFIAYFTKVISDLPIMLICTYRPDHVPSYISEPHVNLLNLSRLDSSQAGALVTAVQGDVDLTPDTIGEIVGRSDGVPLFIEEVTRTIIDAQSSGGSGAVAVPVPNTLHGSLLARLDRVPGAGQIAPIGAAIGRTFPRYLLVSVSEANADEIDAVLERLVSAQLMTRQGRGEDAEYTFRHALVQDAAYSIMPKTRRVNTHARLADALEAFSAADSRVRPDELARHHFGGGRIERACFWWSRAAKDATRNYASVEAVRFINTALEATENLEDSSLRIKQEIELRELLRIPLARAHMGSVQNEINFERLIELKQTSGRDADLLAELHGLAARHVIIGRVADSGQYAQRVLALAENDGGHSGAASSPQFRSVARVLGLRLRGFAEFLRGEFTEAVATFRDMIAALEHADQTEISNYYHADSAIVAKVMICWALAHDGDFEGLGRARKSALAATEETDDWSRAYGYSILATAAKLEGNVDLCADLCLRAMALSEEKGYTYWSSWCAILYGWVLAQTGQTREGCKEVRRGIEVYGTTGGGLLYPLAFVLEAECLLADGRISDARRAHAQWTENTDLSEMRYNDAMSDQIARELA